jgi:cytochrome oxidase assembly protein ShyY1
MHFRAEFTSARRGFGKFIPTLAAIVVTGVTLRLGIWQLDRAKERDLAEEKLQVAQLAPPVDLPDLSGALSTVEALEYHPVKVQGRWLSDKVVFLDNRIYQDQFGYEVLMPLQMTDGKRTVLVDRGWVKSTGDRHRLPSLETSGSVQNIIGIARQRTPRVGSVGKGAREGSIWSEVTPEQFSAWSGVRVQPLILYQTSAAADGLIRDWPHPGSGAERNRGYAVQWFAMAAMTLVFWGYHTFRGRRGRTVES